MKWLLKIAAMAVCSPALTAFASADTLQLVNVNEAATTPIGGEYVGPYGVAVHRTIPDMYCLDINRSVSVGETWTATQTVLSTSSSVVQKETAVILSLIYQQFTVYTAVDGSQSANGLAQHFMGKTPISPTLEPGSLLLLGTGLFGSAGILFRRARTTV